MFCLLNLKRDQFIESFTIMQAPGYSWKSLKMNSNLSNKQTVYTKKQYFDIWIISYPLLLPISLKLNPIQSMGADYAPPLQPADSKNYLHLCMITD